ncbi:MAG: DUF2007 domain-containing protein [Bdellovibrionales bacterium]|nr:DUF2007 domain-containing protein [Bdellovibrionales bacterium]
MSQFKNIRTYESLIEAEGARSYLEAHQITAQLPDRHALYHQPHLIGILGGVRLQVPEEKFAEAERLLIEIERRSHLKTVEHLPPLEKIQEDRRKIAVKWFARLAVGFFVGYYIFIYFK